MEQTDSEETNREVNVRAETRLDHDSIRDVNEAAFDGDGETTLVDSLRSRPPTSQNCRWWQSWEVRSLDIFCSRRYPLNRHHATPPPWP
jgi:hypothetical protein